MRGVKEKGLASRKLDAMTSQGKNALQSDFIFLLANLKSKFNAGVLCVSSVEASTRRESTGGRRNFVFECQQGQQAMENHEERENENNNGPKRNEYVIHFRLSTSQISRGLRALSLYPGVGECS